MNRFQGLSDWLLSGARLSMEASLFGLEGYAVWRCKDGSLVRLNEMSYEHLANAYAYAIRNRMPGYMTSLWKELVLRHQMSAQRSPKVAR